ncbi:zinc finger protein 830 [Macrotis lagotis]|uniref:zinc finger protein 830 n=1 Tax=Macrotis lagotis TaxID=92651 RepID=UPI003D689AFF
MLWKESRGAEAPPRAAEMASSGKRTVKQDELRRLMKSEKQRLSAGRKRVESPFAKYNRLGQLSCALCGVPVKSELLWPAHALGKPHKEKVALLKGPREPAPGPAPPGPAPPPDLKRARADGPAPPAVEEPPPKAPARTLLPDYEDDDEDDEQEQQEQQAAPPGPPPGLPPDFFDHDAPPAPAVFHSGSIQKAEVQEKVVERRENSAEALPEGFFDDPEVDARVRKVDAPKDQMDKEWDEFQKAMRQVSTVSEAIVAKEDEKGRLDRQIGELYEQIECYRRVETLRDRREGLRSRRGPGRAPPEPPAEGQPSPAGSEDEGELQELLSQDWRVKGALL